MNVSKNGHALLGALWRSSELFHQISALERSAHCFKNIPVSSISEAVSKAYALSTAGTETYFGPAEYLTPDSRKAANVAGAGGFFLDIDCGPEKAAAGKGYSTVKDAEEALRKFRMDAGLPEPTHIVYTGGGIQVYWALAGIVDRETWQEYAAKLKRLTHAHGLLADDSRTADIASVMRVPGTKNFKYDPPRSVFLQHASPASIEQSTMLTAIDRAHSRTCKVAATQLPRHPAKVNVSGTISESATHGPVDLETLTSALAILDPDCDDKIWKLRRIAPLAEAARAYPYMERDLRDLARSWSSGELQGVPSKKWLTPGGNGRTGKQVFDAVWERFRRGHYAGRPTTIGTIYFDAMEAGWGDLNDQFEALDCKTEGGE